MSINGTRNIACETERTATPDHARPKPPRWLRETERQPNGGQKYFHSKRRRRRSRRPRRAPCEVFVPSTQRPIATTSQRHGDHLRAHARASRIGDVGNATAQDCARSRASRAARTHRAGAWKEQIPALDRWIERRPSQRPSRCGDCANENGPEIPARRWVLLSGARISLLRSRSVRRRRRDRAIRRVPRDSRA